jgi:glutamyl-tRNA reductase
LAARHLVAHGAESVFVSSRNFEKASQMADRFHGQAIPFEQLYQTCDQADIVITSTAAPHAIFRREHGELFLRRRKNRPMIFIDIAVPRDVAAEMNELSGVFVYNIDDLQYMISSNVATRLKEGSVAEAIVQDEVTRFRARVRMIDATPTILSLQSYFETIRQAEMDRVRGRLGTLTREQEMAIEAVSRGIVNKILHRAISALKSASRELEANTIVELLQHLFDLEITDHKT